LDIDLKSSAIVLKFIFTCGTADADIDGVTLGVGVLDGVTEIVGVTVGVAVGVGLEIGDDDGVGVTVGVLVVVGVGVTTTGAWKYLL